MHFSRCYIHLFLLLSLFTLQLCKAEDIIVYHSLFTNNKSDLYMNAELTVNNIGGGAFLRLPIQVTSNLSDQDILADHLQKYHFCESCRMLEMIPSFLNLQSSNIKCRVCMAGYQAEKFGYTSGLGALDIHVGFIQSQAPSAVLKCEACNMDINFSQALSHFDSCIKRNPLAYKRLRSFSEWGLKLEHAMVLARAGLELDSDNGMLLKCNGCDYQLKKDDAAVLQESEQSSGYYPPLLQHMDLSPNCKFVKKILEVLGANTRKSLNYVARYNRLCSHDFSVILTDNTKAQLHANGVGNQEFAAEMLAKAGFKLAEDDSDSAICLFCEARLHGWERSDNPNFEHSKHHPTCLLSKLGFSDSVKRKAEEESKGIQHNAQANTAQSASAAVGSHGLQASITGFKPTSQVLSDNTQPEDAFKNLSISESPFNYKPALDEVSEQQPDGAVTPQANDNQGEDTF